MVLGRNKDLSRQGSNFSTDNHLLIKVEDADEILESRNSWISPLFDICWVCAVDRFLLIAPGCPLNSIGNL